MEFLLVSVLLTCFLLLILHWIGRGSRSSSRKLPPGPRRLPVIGNLLDIGREPHKSLAKLSETHGPLMSLKLGQVTTVVISSPMMAKEILHKQDRMFLDRTVPEAIKPYNHHLYGMSMIEASTLWKNLRRICNSYLFTPQRLDANQELRREKVKGLLAEVEECCRTGKAIDLGQVAFNTTLNLTFNTFFSVDLSDTSSDVARELKEVMGYLMQEIGKPNLADYFFVLREIDPQGIKRRSTVLFGKLLDLLDRIINERLRLRKEHGSITTNDLLDDLLNIREEKDQELDLKVIRHLLLELLVAGNYTTSTAFEWTMAELLRNPEVLSKAQAELKQTIRKESSVEESDSARLLYLNAIIKETFRLHPPLPLVVPRKASSDVEINGFTVPKDAQVLINAWAVGRNPSVWDNPDRFMPERFLGSDIDFKGRECVLIPFGGGRRICPGLPLATRMLHLMLGSVIRSFNWKLKEGVTPERLDMEERFGLVLQKAQPLEAIPLQVL